MIIHSPFNCPMGQMASGYEQETTPSCASSQYITSLAIHVSPTSRNFQTFVLQFITFCLNLHLIVCSGNSYSQILRFWDGNLTTSTSTSVKSQMIDYHPLKSIKSGLFRKSSFSTQVFTFRVCSSSHLYYCNLQETLHKSLVHEDSNTSALSG